MLTVMHKLIERMYPRMVELLARHWRDSRSDLVVSLIPHFNRAIFAGLREADRDHDRLTPMATILTDLADYPPHFWIERQEQYFVCGSAVAAQQAIAVGHPRQRVFRTSGMIVRPEFYRRSKLCRDHERRRLGLRPDLPTGLVMFGGCGSRRMLTIARRVAEAGLKAQFIFLCGRNQRLRARLDALELPFPHHAEGFTREVSYFMSLADFFVGKPGPGSISEALVMELPVIVERNASTMLQERYNTEWILQNHLGVVLRSFTEIAKAIELMLDQHQMARFRRQVTLLNNRAAFEIPEVLDTLIKQPSHQSEPYAFQKA
jgi:1,2-diacylglycerol 3-beta-galactosyltransferase